MPWADHRPPVAMCILAIIMCLIVSMTQNRRSGPVHTWLAYCFLQGMWVRCYFKRRGLESSSELKQVLEEVQEWAGSFAMPGFDVSALKAGHSANGHASHLENGFADTNGIPLENNELSTNKAFDPKAEHANLAN